MSDEAPTTEQLGAAGSTPVRRNYLFASLLMTLSAHLTTVAFLGFYKIGNTPEQLVSMRSFARFSATLC